MTTRDVGDRINLRHLVYDASQTLVNATVALTVTDPTGATTTPTVTSSATGTYDAAFTLSSAGTWTWVWTVSGTVVDIEHGAVTAVDPSPPAYCSLSLLKQALGMDAADTSRDDLLRQALTAGARGIEQYCDGRRFYLDLTASARIYPTVGRVITTCDGHRLNVDDIGTSTITVEVGDGTTWTATTAFETWPPNALARGQAITGLVTTTNPTLWTNRRARITTRWGWPQIPSAVEQANLLQSSRLFRRKDSPEGVAGSADWGLVRVPNMDPDVKALLAFLTTPFKAA